MPCHCSHTMLTGILANYRQKSKPVLVRTILTHTLSCLLHLLIDSAIVLAGRAAASNALRSGKAATGNAAELVVFTFYMWQCEINCSIILLNCEKMVYLVFIVVGQQ